MSNEPSIKNVLTAVQDLNYTVQGLQSDIHEVKTEVKDLRTGLQEVKTEVKDLRTTVDDVVGAVQELSSQNDRQFASVRQEMTQMKSDLMTQIDGFLVLHKTSDVELVTVRHRCDRLENFADKVAERLDMKYKRV